MACCGKRSWPSDNSIATFVIGLLTHLRKPGRDMGKNIFLTRGIFSGPRGIFSGRRGIFSAGDIFWAAGNIFCATGNIFSAGNIFWAAGNNFWVAGNSFSQGIFSCRTHPVAMNIKTLSGRGPNYPSTTQSISCLHIHPRYWICKPLI